MGAQNYFSSRAGYPKVQLNFFLLYVKTKAIYWQQKTAWLKFKFENSDVSCAAVNKQFCAYTYQPVS